MRCFYGQTTRHHHLGRRLRPAVCQPGAGLLRRSGEHPMLQHPAAAGSGDRTGRRVSGIHLRLCRPGHRPAAAHRRTGGAQRGAGDPGGAGAAAGHSPQHPGVAGEPEPVHGHRDHCHPEPAGRDQHPVHPLLPRCAGAAPCAAGHHHRRAALRAGLGVRGDRPGAPAAQRQHLSGAGPSAEMRKHAGRPLLQGISGLTGRAVLRH